MMACVSRQERILPISQPAPYGRISRSAPDWSSTLCTAPQKSGGPSVHQLPITNYKLPGSTYSLLTPRYSLLFQQFSYFQFRPFPTASHSIVVATRFCRVSSRFASVIHSMYSLRCE